MDIEQITNLKLDPTRTSLRGRGIRFCTRSASATVRTRSTMLSSATFTKTDSRRFLRSAPCSAIRDSGSRIPSTRSIWVKVLHAEQAFTIDRPLAGAGEVRGEFKVVGIEDKGPRVLAACRKTLYDVADGTKLATVRSTNLLRGDGGQATWANRCGPQNPCAAGEPDRIVEIATLARAALIVPVER